MGGLLNGNSGREWIYHILWSQSDHITFCAERGKSFPLPSSSSFVSDVLSAVGLTEHMCEHMDLHVFVGLFSF